jgi:hypothetical protein
MNFKRTVPWVFAAASAIILACVSPNGNGGTDTGNARVTGIVYNADGSRAGGAAISFIPASQDPTSSGGNPLFAATTDDTGGYRFDSLPADTYNALGSGQGNYSFIGAIKIGAARISVPACTLLAPGSVSGVIRLQPGDDPRTVLLLFIGTSIWAVPTDLSGNFSVQNLAQGTYRVRILTTLNRYIPMDTSFTIRSGVDTVLPKPLQLSVLYSIIPVPFGLQATYDTLHQTVSLSWNRINSPAVPGYCIYRKNVDLNTILAPLTTTLITDTFYRDTTCASGYTFEYKLCCVDTSDVQGGLSSGISIMAAPRYLVTTYLQMSEIGTVNDTTSILDSIRVIAGYQNVTKCINKLVWLEDTSSTPLRTVSPADSVGSDTLHLVWPAAGTHVVKVAATDASGVVWRDSIAVVIIQDLPIPFAGKDSAVFMDSLFALHGKATSRFGHIVKWEWNIGNSGFRTTATGDTVIVTPDSLVNAWPCILRVTDNHGNVASDTMVLQVGRWVPLGGAGFTAGQINYPSFAVSNDTPYLAFQDIANNSAATVMRFVNRQWAPLGPAGFTLGPVYGTALAVAGGTPCMAYNLNGSQIAVVQFSASQWQTLPPIDSSGTASYAAISAGSLCAAGGMPYLGLYSGQALSVGYYVNNGWIKTGALSAGSAVPGTVAVWNGIPYVSYYADTTLKVLQYGNGQWDTLGIIGNTVTSTHSFALGNGIPYLAYSDAAAGNMATVLYYTGTQWNVVGNRGFSGAAISSLSLALWNGTPYVAFSDGGSTTVMSFNGSQWRAVGARQFSGLAIKQQLAISSGHLYVAFIDVSNGNRATVMRLQ